MISVCMATYNGERFLREQIDSILCQLAPDDELIISDDGSTDGTLEIIDSYKDSRIRLLHHQKKENIFFNQTSVLYATENFFYAMEHALGDYIFLADQDDIWNKNKVEKCIELLQSHFFIMSNFSIINANGIVEKERFYSKNPFKKTMIYNLLTPHFIGCCCCFRKEVLKKAMPFPKTVYSHDLWLGLVAFCFKEIFFYDFPLIKHRLTDFNSSTACKSSNNSLFFRIRYRILIFIELFKKGKMK